MADKKKDTTVSIKLESAVIKRVEELTKTIEEKLALLTPQRLGEEFDKVLDDFRELNIKLHDLGSEYDNVYDRVRELTGKSYGRGW